MTDKEKLIDFLESSRHEYEIHNKTGITLYENINYDSYIKIKGGCGYNMWGEFYFLNDKSIGCGFLE